MHTAWVNSLKSFGNFIHPYNQSHSEDIEHFYQLFFASCHFAGRLPLSWHQATRDLWSLTSNSGPSGKFQEA